MIHIPRSYWLAACMVVAGLMVLNGFYYDYGDRYAWAWLASVFLAVAWIIPRAMLLVSGGTATVSVVLGLLLSPPDASELLTTARTGMSRPQLRALAGEPDNIVAGLEDLLSLDHGYNVPSPYRFHHDGPIEIYYGVDRAYYFFYRDDLIIDVYVGGS